MGCNRILISANGGGQSLAKFGKDEAGRIGKELFNASQDCLDYIKALREAHPDWHPDNDARISGFAKLSNVERSTAIGIKFYADFLTDQDWWVANSSGYSAQDCKRINSAYMDLQKIAAIQGGFSAIESTLRVLLRAVDAGACCGGMAEFKSIYECLFRTKLTNQPSEGIELLDLLREVRNTVHNNGVYFNIHGHPRVTVSYRGDDYHFVHASKLDFVDWDVLISLLRDSAKLLLEVVNDPVIVAPGSITDPYA